MWVSFPLGRPLGIPNDPAFQRRVLLHALKLLEQPTGPVLEDFPDDITDEPCRQPSVPACSFDFNSRGAVAPTAIELLLNDFRTEMGMMYNWYKTAHKQQQRTTYGLSGLQPNAIATLFEMFIAGKPLKDPEPGQTVADLLRLAAEDLKALYFEAITAQPGQAGNAASLANWFWGETFAAAVINEVRKCCLTLPGREMQLNGTLLLVPRNQRHRFS